ncbi:MAG: selenide, water dikinase SelD [Lewinellaceae bacterium]|nr:selenide, water dikinase SelD [Lewinellaceae bacterium]
MANLRLTEYSHGAGCGCKLSPGVLSDILQTSDAAPAFTNLLVGNDTKDDAAVVDLDGSTAIISTTDFFMPIVDDPFDFGAIAATNAISDIYAMGGTPIVAIAILGWPIDKIPAAVAGEVLRGGRKVCHDAGIALAGGHSIDAPEPIFGLAVTGRVPVTQVKKNCTGQPGDLLYLTKPLGIGMVTTAQKKKLAEDQDLAIARQSMLTLNKIGQSLAGLPYVHAITDVTGFGLGGHLLEICEGSNTGAQIHLDRIPVFDFVPKYIALGCLPGGTNRNWTSYGHKIALRDPDTYKIIADPQTSGGLLIAVNSQYKSEFESLLAAQGLVVQPIGMLTTQPHDHLIEVD